MRQASFAFDSDETRPREYPTEYGTRFVWIILTLLRGRRVDIVQVMERFDCSTKTVRRDVTKLKKTLKRLNFSGEIVASGKAQYQLRRGPAVDVCDDDQQTLDLVREIARGLGGPVAAKFLPSAAECDPFFRISAPRLVADTPVAQLFEYLKKAAAAHARVVFDYRNQRGEVREREVEPYHVVWSAGRYYLVGYDTKGGFRQFALDAIFASLPLKKTGTFTRRPMPARYQSDDAIGLFKSGEPNTVRVSFSPLITAAITSREWQRRERVEPNPDGGATITLYDCDIDEVVRWAMSFGDKAKVVAPETAVARAKEMALSLAASYETRRNVVQAS